jgi:hypothetical protein
VKHLIDAGVDRHTVMRFSGDATESMLHRYTSSRSMTCGGRRNVQATTLGRTGT